MELSDEDRDLARSVADSLKRQIAEIKKQIMEQRRKNRQKDLEIGRKNDQKKAIWVLQTLKLQKKLHETNDLLETAKVQWKLEKLKLKNSLLTLEQWQKEEAQFRLTQIETSWKLLLNLTDTTKLGPKNSGRFMHIGLEEEVTGVPPENSSPDQADAVTPKEDSSRVVITDQMRSMLRSRLNDLNSFEVKRKLSEIAKTLQVFIKALRHKVKPMETTHKEEVETYSPIVEEESSSSAPNSERSCEESPLKLIKPERPKRAKWYERLCRCLS
mmetsp:Transcript_19692/g.36245  ORF Transcript_19692/g.36245 Transcript_19692/m.36245 type:complete len:271 (-) Transcript_19692:25-837(-)